MTIRDRRRAFCFQERWAMDVLRGHWPEQSVALSPTGEQEGSRSAAIAVYQAITDLANRRKGVAGREGFEATRAAVAAMAGVSTKTLDRIVPGMERLGLIRVVREVRGDGLNLPLMWILPDLDDDPEGGDTMSPPTRGGDTVSLPQREGVATQRPHPRDTVSPPVGTSRPEGGDTKSHVVKKNSNDRKKEPQKRATRAGDWGRPLSRDEQRHRRTAERLAAASDPDRAAQDAEPTQTELHLGLPEAS